MKNKILKTIFLLLFSVLFIFSKNINAQCSLTQNQITVHVYYHETCDSGGVEVPDQPVYFYTVDDPTPGDHESFTLYTDDYGIITHCFSKGKHFFCYGTNLDCPDPCPSQFYPSNDDCAVLLYTCNSNVNCYCDSQYYPCYNSFRKNHHDETPSKFFLYQNYPNPFNPVTSIQFDLPKASYVKLTVFDLDGKKIATLIDGNSTIGNHKVEFDGANLSSGVYLYKLETPYYNEVKKMILVK